MIEVGLLTGGIDRPYALGLAGALIAKGVSVDFVGSDDLESVELRSNPIVRVFNLRGDQREEAHVGRKMARVMAYYARLMRYVAGDAPKVVHILWNNRFQHFDRTALMMWYRLLGKKVVLTAHNVNAELRDGRDSLANRLTLWMQYHLCDHIFVHTPAMKAELRRVFGVGEEMISVIPIGMNNAVPRTGLTGQEARRRLGIGPGERMVLFFGRIGPYKGLDILLEAFHRVAASDGSYRLIIAGKPKSGSEQYMERVRALVEREVRGRVIQTLGFVPDEDTEVYFKASDVLILPYTDVSQSGVLVLAYSFGLPVIAADVGSLRQDILEGRTGYVCRPRDPEALAQAIDAYFGSDLFKELKERRRDIERYAAERFSWDRVGRTTRQVYGRLVGAAVD